jgi:DNA mismatch repair protein MutS2
MGILKATLPVTQLKPIASSTRAARSNVKITLQKAMSASTEIHLRHQRYEEAERELERFVDDAILAGLASIRIVHGKGEGILRKMTQELLRRHPDVASYRDADANEGGHGVTVAVFK